MITGVVGVLYWRHRASGWLDEEQHALACLDHARNPFIPSNITTAFVSSATFLLLCAWAVTCRFWGLSMYTGWRSFGPRCTDMLVQ
jgi:hypothetical protein